MIASGTSLIYISYPIKILMKSSKILMIVFINTIFPTGEKVPKYKYTSCVIITMGLLIFSWKGQNDKAFNYFGFGLCCVSLVFDGL